jgi:hypothetical protein
MENKGGWEGGGGKFSGQSSILKKIKIKNKKCAK